MRLPQSNSSDKTANGYSISRKGPISPVVRLFFLLISLLVGCPVLAQNKPDPGGSTAMQESLAKQRLSIQKQLNGTRHSSFFSLPPPEPIGADMLDAPGDTPAPAPDCEALADAELGSLIDEAARREDLQPDLLRGVIRQESGARPCAVSPKGAQGLMQLMPATSQQFGVSDPFDPRQNVQAGAKFLKQLLTRYGGDTTRALAAYNAGPARVDQAGAIPKIPETLRYVSSILGMLPH